MSKSKGEVVLLARQNEALTKQLGEARAEVIECQLAIKEAPRQLREALKQAKVRRADLAQLAGSSSPESLATVILNQWADPDAELRQAAEAARVALVLLERQLPEARLRVSDLSARAEAAGKEFGEGGAMHTQELGKAEEATRDLEELQGRIEAASAKLADRTALVAEAVQGWWDANGKLSPEEEAEGLQAFEASGVAKRLEAIGS